MAEDCLEQSTFPDALCLCFISASIFFLSIFPAFSAFTGKVRDAACPHWVHSVAMVSGAWCGFPLWLFESKTRIESAIAYIGSAIVVAQKAGVCDAGNAWLVVSGEQVRARLANQ